ncbi:MAG: glycosyltransferase family 4 protein [Bacteroidales bacterium]|nr:glycosyltransferase family 4 protein [Bacteroidales bacterium]
MQHPKKILFLVAHRPGRSPGQRFRFEQYLDYLKQNGFECHVSWLINKQDDLIFYAEGKYLAKTRFLFKSLLHRWNDLKKINDYDLVFFYREAHMIGITWFEKKIKKAGIKMLVDFDDSIWLRDISNGNRRLAFLKKPSKTGDIIKMCDACIVGNQFLADYARHYNPKVFVIPTTIDTEYYIPPDNGRNDKKVVIGWTGSSTTLKHFSLAVPVLRKLREKFGERVSFRMISDEFFYGELEGLEKVKWARETEVKDLSVIDIGIMPLPDDDWSRGKCGFKGLQYMALARPAVMSPVGVNNEIISHGKNGFLADSPEEWEKILSQLIEDAELRKKIGEAGRKTVEERFSFRSQKDHYLKIFSDLTRS